jgi:hypothetical protein
MGGEKNTNTGTRIQIRLMGQNYDKLLEIADRYGMSVNSLASFVIGQWLDQHENNASLREKMNDQLIDTTVKHFSSGDQMTQVLNNPVMAQLMSSMLEKVMNETMKKA